MTRCSTNLMAAAVLALVTPALAQAQASTTWVSGSSNTTGVQAELGGLVRVAGNTVVENGTGFTCGSGVISAGGEKNQTAANGRWMCVDPSRVRRAVVTCMRGEPAG